MIELFRLVGSQTTQDVNSIAVQPGKFGCVPTERALRKKRCRRSIAEQPKLRFEETLLAKE